MACSLRGLWPMLLPTITWKTGSHSLEHSRWSPFRSWSMTFANNVSHLQPRAAFNSQGIANSTNGGRHSFQRDIRAGAGLRWADVESKTSGRASTAVAAGRSKAQKGKKFGGRIESRGKPGYRKDGDGGEKKSNPEEDEMNATWESVGLGDRRSGGKFMPEKPQRPKQLQRVGGWGRDKSMQRAITPEQQRAEQAKRLARKERKPPNKGPVKKSKLYEGFDDDPDFIHPPEYYVYGPYGPHHWKGYPVGNLVSGNYSTNQVVYFSNVADDEEDLDIEKGNLTVNFQQDVFSFDRSIGVQYFYAFARRNYKPRTVPWKDWTLVAEIAIEHGEEIEDQALLFKKMGRKAQDITTQCIAWARPDIIYVRRPNSQLRLERQKDFLMEFFNLLDPRKDESDSENYYATLCRLLNVAFKAEPEDVRAAYRNLDEESRLKCLEHVFTNHPVKVLSSASYDKQVREQEEGYLEEENVISSGTSDDQSGDEDRRIEHTGQSFPQSWNSEGLKMEFDQNSQSLEQNWNSEGVEEVSGMEEDGLAGGSEERDQPDDDDWGTKWSSKSTKHRQFGWRGRGKEPRLWAEPAFRSAVRPYSYDKIIEEIARLRKYLCEKQARMGELFEPLQSLAKQDREAASIG